MKPRPARLCVALLTAALTGCGIPTDDTPRPIPSVDAPSTVPGSTSTHSAEPGAPTETLYLVRDGRLVAVWRAADSAATLDSHLQHLLAGPTEAERNAGLTSALTGLGITAQVRLQGAEAVVDLGNRPDDAGRSDEVLAYGQLVCTLTARPDVETVSFHYQNEPVGVPRADGSLATGPLTTTDYAQLVAD